MTRGTRTAGAAVVAALATSVGLALGGAATGAPAHGGASHGGTAHGGPAHGGTAHHGAAHGGPAHHEPTALHAGGPTARPARPTARIATPRPRAPAATTTRNPGRLLVTATEFRLTLSRPSVARGVVIVQLRVAGEDPHDLTLQRLDARGRPTGPVRRIPRVGPGAVGTGEFRLTRGRWRLTCTVPGHARMGMVAPLTVR